MNNFAAEDLDFFLVQFALPQEIIENFKNVDLKYPEIFTIQPSGKRMYISLQNFKEYPFYKEDTLHNLKLKVAEKMGLNYDDYAEVRDSIGINFAGVGIGPHVDIVERQHVNCDQSNLKKQKLVNEWIKTNSHLGDGYDVGFVQMRCNLFIIEPEKGQDAWVEDKVHKIPRGGYGVAFNSGKLHGTTPGSHKKMTLSLGYLLRTETFRELVKKNHKSSVNIYVDKKYMYGQYPD